MVKELFKIAIADDHDIVRKGIRAIIKTRPDWHVVAEAANGTELVENLRSNPCDLVILDIFMPEKDGIAAIDRIQLSFPEVKILVLTMLKDENVIKKIMRQGVHGFLNKDDLVVDSLCDAIEQIRNGERFIPHGVFDKLLGLNKNESSVPLNVLTEREQEVAGLIARGLKSKEIAKHLGISLNTVSNHRASIAQKLGAKNVADIVKFALQYNLN